MNEKRTWESDMSDAFDRRVRDLHEAPLSFEQVTTRARGIRRRRQAAVAGGVLAVAAVLTPIAVVTAGDGPGRGNEIPAATDTPTPSVTDSATAALPDPGPEPMIGHLEADTFVRGDGVAFALPGTGYTRADQIGDNEIVAYRYDTTTTGGGGVIDVVTAPVDGGTSELVESIPVADSYVASPLGLTIAYRSREGEIVTRWDGGAVSIGTDYPENAFPAAVTGGPDCDEDAGGCIVYLNDGAGEEAPITVSSDGTVDTPVPDAQFLRDADQGLLSVLSEASDDGSCGGLYDSSAGSYLFETCDYTVSIIAPSGEHVLAAPAYLDGLGDSFVAILDRAGTEVARWEEGGAVVSRAWEDPGHVVFTVYADGAWSVWRLGIDGESERLLGPEPGSDADPPMQFFQ